MAVITSSWMVDSVVLMVTFIYLIYRYLMRNANHFKDRNIPFLPEFPVVGILELFTMSQRDLSQYLYNKFPEDRFYGYFQFTKPSLLVKDPDLIQRIMVKDFAHFHDRPFPPDETDPLANNLFDSRGIQWRSLRQKLIPTFSTGKLKQMFDQVGRSSSSLMEDINKLASSGEPVDSRSLFNEIAVEIIASVAFGLDFSRRSPQAVEFSTHVRNVFDFTPRTILFIFLMTISRRLALALKFRNVPPKTTDFFVNLTKATKDYRMKNGIKRNDYFQLLLTLQEAEESGKNFLSMPADNNEEDALINQMDYKAQYSASESNFKLFTDDRITGQSFVFLAAGTESVASTISFALYELGKHPDIQSRLVEEVDTARAKHGAWTYQAVKDMLYMDQVLQETQRLFPVMGLIMRECTIPYPVPGSSYIVAEGSFVVIPVQALHRDPKYYPDPEVFNPDRFADNNYRPSATFMPFGDGPRICIAMRFAIMEMKVILANILSQYSVHVNSKTKEPFTFAKISFIPMPEGGIWLDFKKRTQSF